MRVQVGPGEVVETLSLVGFSELNLKLSGFVYCYFSIFLFLVFVLIRMCLTFIYFYLFRFII